MILRVMRSLRWVIIITRRGSRLFSLPWLLSSALFLETPGLR
jgi:hypothetical protein